jgi:hypothetical protein
MTKTKSPVDSAIGARAFSLIPRHTKVAHIRRRTFVSSAAALMAAGVASPAFSATINSDSWDLNPPTDTRDNFIS